MKKFAFRLKRVLDIRRTPEQLKLTAFGSEQRKLSVEEKKLNLFQSEATSQTLQMRTEQTAPFAAWMKNGNARYLKRISHAVDFQTRAVTNQKKTVEDARTDYLDARRRTQSIEHLRDKQHEEWRMEDLRDESKQLDEFGGSRRGDNS
jgi:flagellar FliJ protein